MKILPGDPDAGLEELCAHHDVLFHGKFQVCQDVDLGRGEDIGVFQIAFGQHGLAQHLECIGSDG